jgi:hypothetical protein
MPKIPDPTKSSLHQRLIERPRQRWLQLHEIRLRYGGSARNWGFAMYRDSHDDYEDSYLPQDSWAKV